MPNTEELMNDADVILACQRGDHESFGILVRRYEKELMGHALALLGNREDALDVLQETFVRAFQSVNRFQTERKFYPWIYGIMRNLAMDRFRKKVREERHQDKLWKPAELNPGYSELGERIQLLWRALGRLSQGDREIIVLKHLEGRKYDEISEILQIVPGTVMSRLYRARRKLRELIGKQANLNRTDGVRLK